MASKGHIVTFGIIPTKPEIGYGYIEKMVMMWFLFKRKPNQVTAIDSLLRKGNFFMNSGYVLF
jgi:mannose-1-phosphate guanylyltransferase